MRPPPSLRDYAVGGRYFRAKPEPPAVRARIPVFNPHSEGSSSASAPFVYARTDEEERAAIAETARASAEAAAAMRRRE